MSYNHKEVPDLKHLKKEHTLVVQRGTGNLIGYLMNDTEIRGNEFIEDTINVYAVAIWDEKPIVWRGKPTKDLYAVSPHNRN